MSQIFARLNFHALTPQSKADQAQYTWLEEEIELEGGTLTFHDTVEELTSSHGLILLIPDNPKTFKLLSKTNIKENDVVRAQCVHWGYPKVCIDRGELIEDLLAVKKELLFVRTADLEGWKFYVRSSAGTRDERLKCMELIEAGGGQLMDKKEAAQILIESPDVDELEATREKYTLKPGTRVESRVWLEDQVQRGSLQFTPPPKLPMPGRIPVSAGGLARRPYTDQDKKNLIVYLAKCYPKNEGRSGNTLYQTMVATGGEWARHHTWQSWRHHYIARKDYYTRQVEVYLARNGTLFRDGHGQDPRSRAHNKNKIGRAVVEIDDAGPANGEQQETEAVRRRKRPSASQVPRPRSNDLDIRTRANLTDVIDASVDVDDPSGLHDLGNDFGDTGLAPLDPEPERTMSTLVDTHPSVPPSLVGLANEPDDVSEDPEDLEEIVKSLTSKKADDLSEGELASIPHIKFPQSSRSLKRKHPGPERPKSSTPARKNIPAGYFERSGTSKTGRKAYLKEHMNQDTPTGQAQVHSRRRL